MSSLTPRKSKVKTVYVCQACGTNYPKPQGRCSACGAWNQIIEERLVETPAARSIGGATGWVPAVDRRPKPLQAVPNAAEARLPLPDAEFSRVLDGGLVPGSLILLGGEPGIGKSTLLLQLALRLQGHRVLYVTGEESERQVKMRADRIPFDNPEVYVVAETQLEQILEYLHELAPTLVILDSIQTVYTSQLESTPGSMAQIRECAALLLNFAKQTQTSVVLVGHITKDGNLAGPKVLEHMVDVVLEFEGDRNYSYRLVRSKKNRFGATPELGIYEMAGQGLREVSNPSELFLNQTAEPFSGVAIATSLQGVRPLLLETQALVSDATYGTPQRSATGFDLKRLNMLLAVLEKRCGFKVGAKDVFINLAGGIKLEDPALDLSVVCAIVSSLYNLPIPSGTAFAAEVSLTGEVRGVSRLEPRLAEAHKLGFTRVFVSAHHEKSLVAKSQTLDVVPVLQLEAVFQQLFGA
jgi:DNA repair protein RadA/Sms